MKSNENIKNERLRLKFLLILASLFLVTGCAKNLSLVQFERPDYQVINIDTTPPSEEGLSICKEELKKHTSEVINMCASYYDLIGYYWDSINVIANYEAIDCWNDNLNFKDRPANYLLRK